jgi:hypothetical protein
MSKPPVRSDAGGDQRARTCSNAGILAHYLPAPTDPGRRRDYPGDALGLSRRGAATDGEGDRLLRLHFRNRNAASHASGKTVLISTGDPGRG